jgi:hypothetical protein
MKLLKFVMFLFYKYYTKGGTHRIPYFSTLVAVAFILYIHFFQVLIIFDFVDLLPMKQNDDKIIKYFKFAAFFLPIMFFISLIVKEKDIRGANYNDDRIQRGGKRLILYLVSSFLFLLILMLLN